MFQISNAKFTMGVTNGEGNVIRVVKFVIFMVIVCLCSFCQSAVFFIMFCEPLLASLTFFLSSMVLSVLRFMAPDYYLFRIFKVFLSLYTRRYIIIVIH